MRKVLTRPLSESIDEPAALPSHEEIAIRAHALFEHRGCEDGHDVRDWLEAESQLLTEQGSFRPAHLPSNATHVELRSIMGA